MRGARLKIMRGFIVLALGALTTVAIAWLAMIFRPARSGESAAGHGQLTTDSYTTRFWTHRARGLLQISWYGEHLPSSWAKSGPGEVRTECVPSWSQALAPGPDYTWNIPYMGLDYRYEIATGWPMLAMHTMLRLCERRDEQRYELPEWPYTALTGIQLRALEVEEFLGPVRSPRALPLRVLPLGFAVNTAIAAALWWLLLFAFPTTRRFLRRRRGACLKCGYGPLPSLEARCSECGWNRGVSSNRASAVGAAEPD